MVKIYKNSTYTLPPLRFAPLSLRWRVVISWKSWAQLNLYIFTTTFFLSCCWSRYNLFLVWLLWWVDTLDYCKIVVRFSCGRRRTLSWKRIISFYEIRHFLVFLTLTSRVQNTSPLIIKFFNLKN